MNALGMLEVYSFTAAVCAADVCAKSGGVKITAFDRNRPKSADVPAPLVMHIKLEGGVADVKAAVEAGAEYAKSKGKYIVSHVIPRPAEKVDRLAYRLDINKDKFNKKLPKTFLGYDGEISAEPHCIGLLEVQGLVAAITGLDAMAKAADVRLVHTEKRLGGRLVTLVITGRIDAVESALGAGREAAKNLGDVFGCEAIANLHPEVARFFDFSE